MPPRSSTKRACTALRNGDEVEVKGTKQTDGTVLASKVEKDDDEDDDEDADDNATTGTIMTTRRRSGDRDRRGERSRVPGVHVHTRVDQRRDGRENKVRAHDLRRVINGISVKVEGRGPAPRRSPPAK